MTRIKPKPKNQTSLSSLATTLDRWTDGHHAYSLGVMGFRTPNIDRIAKEGMIVQRDGLGL
jgi:hypothetical protein